MAYRSMTDLAHFLAAEIIQPGDSCVDATAGNGHDTLALAQLVGPSGKVIALDIQPAALAACAERLHAHAITSSVDLILGSHQNLDQLYPPSLPHPRLILFNLGYLPGGDKSISTDPTSTVLALEKSWELLAPEGRLIVVCYPGHPAGAIESRSVQTWFQSHALIPRKIDPGPTRLPAPFILYSDKSASLVPLKSIE